MNTDKITTTLQLTIALKQYPEEMRSLIQQAAYGNHPHFSRCDALGSVIRAKSSLEFDSYEREIPRIQTKIGILDEFEQFLREDDQGCLTLPRSGIELELRGSIRLFVRPAKRGDAHMIRELLLRMDSLERSSFISSDLLDNTTSLSRAIEEASHDIPAFIVFPAADRETPIGLWRALRDFQFHPCAVLASGTLPSFKESRFQIEMIRLFVSMILEIARGRFSKLFVRLSSAQKSLAEAYQQCGFKIVVEIPGCGTDGLNGEESQIILVREVLYKHEEPEN